MTIEICSKLNTRTIYTGERGKWIRSILEQIMKMEQIIICKTYNSFSRSRNARILSVARLN